MIMIVKQESKRHKMKVKPLKINKPQQFSNSGILTKTETTVECEDLESVNKNIKDLDKEDATSSNEHICKKGNENDEKRSADDNTETDIVPEKNDKNSSSKRKKTAKSGNKIMLNLILTVIMMYHWQKA